MLEGINRTDGAQKFPRFSALGALLCVKRANCIAAVGPAWGWHAERTRVKSKDVNMALLMFRRDLFNVSTMNSKAHSHSSQHVFSHQTS